MNEEINPKRILHLEIKPKSIVVSEMRDGREIEKVTIYKPEKGPLND